MQISKSTHLIKLLRTQDVCISVLAYLLAVNFIWFLGRANLTDAINHLTLVPFVLLFSWLAARLKTLGLHGTRMLLVGSMAFRYALLVTIGMLAIAYISKLEFVSRYVLALYTFILTIGILSNRLFLRWWYFTGRREHPDNFLQVLVIGTGNRARKLMESYLDNSEWGVKIIGMLDPHPATSVVDHDDVPILGDISMIKEILTDQVVDEVIICLPRSLLDDVSEIVAACAEEAVCVKFLADLYEVEGAHYELRQIGTWPVLSINPVARHESSLITKRIVDLVLTIPALIFLLPIFIATAIAIKVDSKGPVFFKQQRVGLNKRKFNMIKFRSMYEDAEQRLAEIEHLNEAEGPIFKMKHDPRITRVGHFIRRSSIDELPQLFNVLVGRMSLVGPRPMSTRDVSLFSKGVQRARFSVRPGLACLREVSGRSELSFEQWLALDLKYIADWSLWLDVKILFKLLPAVIKGDGAS